MKTPPCVQNSADYLHTLVEALKLAYADRDSYYGDPRFVPPPLEPLTRTYAARRVKLIDPDAAPRISGPERWRFA